MQIYVAYGWQGEFFTLHRSKEGAVQALRAEWARFGEDPDEVGDGDNDLDGFYVEQMNVSK